MHDRRALIDAFSSAWAARDLSGVMDLMSSDCEFRSSTGEGPGSSHVGRAAVEAAFAVFLHAEPCPYTVNSPLSVLIGSDFAVTRWTTEVRRPGQPVVRSAACDVFEFVGSAIRLKDTYRKVPTPPG